MRRGRGFVHVAVPDPLDEGPILALLAGHGTRDHVLTITSYASMEIDRDVPREITYIGSIQMIGSDLVKKFALVVTKETRT